MNQIPSPDYNTHPAYGPLFGPPSIRARFTALGTLLPHMIYSFRDYSRWRKFERRHRGQFRQATSALQTEKERTLYEKLVTDGAMGLSLSPAEHKEISELTTPVLNELRAQRSLKEKRIFRDNLIPANDIRLKQALTRILTENGYLRVASAYMKMPLKLGSVFCLIYSKDDTSFWKKKFEGTSLTSPSTTYMHIDSRFGALKFILYLNEVTEKNGPFCYVLGSNRFKRSPAELLVRKSMDLSRLDSLAIEKRSAFWALPKFLRKKAAFGYDLSEDSPETSSLLEREKRFTSKDGQLLIFDYNGIHRGGMVVEGERHILQIQLIPADSEGFK
jgi:hypothetical protein